MKDRRRFYTALLYIAEEAAVYQLYFMCTINLNTEGIILGNAFGRWLAGQRKARFWRQCDLAENMDVSQNTVSKWETGAAFPSRANLEKLAKLFGMTVQEIIQAVIQPALQVPVPVNKGSTESAAKPDPGRKSPEEMLCAIEKELCSERAKNMTLEERKRVLINAMTEFIGQISN